MNTKIVEMLNKIITLYYYQMTKIALFNEEEMPLWCTLGKLIEENEKDMMPSIPIMKDCGDLLAQFSTVYNGIELKLLHRHYTKTFVLPRDMEECISWTKNIPYYFKFDEFQKLKEVFLQMIINALEADCSKNISPEAEAIIAKSKPQTSSFLDNLTLHPNGKYSVAVDGYYVVQFGSCTDIHLTHTERNYLRAFQQFESLNGFKVLRVQKYKD